MIVGIFTFNWNENKAFLLIPENLWAWKILKGSTSVVPRDATKDGGKLGLINVGNIKIVNTNTKLPAVLSHRRSTTVSLETYPFMNIKITRSSR